MADGSVELVAIDGGSAELSGITVNEAAAVAVPRNSRRDMPVGFMGTGKYNGIGLVSGRTPRPRRLAQRTTCVSPDDVQHSENKFHRELNLPGSIGPVRLHEIIRELIVAGIGRSLRLHRILHEGAGGGDHAIGRDGDALVIAIEKIE